MEVTVKYIMNEMEQASICCSLLLCQLSIHI